MKLSKYFWQTYKETPSDAQIVSHQLLMRAGFLSKTANGLYNYHPIAMRVLAKIKNIIREELNKIDCNEMSMSVVTPADLWQETGRWDEQGKLMLKFADRNDRELCMSPTNEEVITDVFRKTITSYKQLPVSLFQINTKFRDELRPRYGLMRGREFTMKDAYTFSLDKESLDSEYKAFFNAYSNIFNRMKLRFISVEADGGTIAGKDQQTHEFQLIADSGEDIIVEAKDIGFAANIEKAQTYRAELEFNFNDKKEELLTENLKTCTDVTNFLKVPAHQSLKSLVFKARYGKKEVYYMILLLGDDELNDVKLSNFLNCDEVTIATDNELTALNLPKGYMSPIEREGFSILFDEAINLDASYIVGANKENFHVSGFIPAKDCEKYKVTDLRLAKEGDLAADKKSPITFTKGIEVGHIFQLGDKYTKAMKAHVLDQNGKKIIPLMGCYGIGVTRVMQAAIEQCNDENGMIWPAPIAPFHVYFAVIGKSQETKDVANEIYQNLKNSNIEILFDDRGMGPGPMFKDADLLGLPIRIVLGERDYKESQELELKVRSTGETLKLKKEDLESNITSLLKDLGL